MSPERKQAEALIDKVLEQLGEHFESVQILACRMAPEGQGTESFFIGCGNWYARQGMAQSFIKTDEAETLANKIGRAGDSEE